jgi:hypothetical protein
VLAKHLNRHFLVLFVEQKRAPVRTTCSCGP